MSQRRRLLPPIRGAANNTPYVDQPGDTAPLESLRNGIAYTTEKDRQVFGQRPGTKRAFSSQLNDAPVQAMMSLSRARQVVGNIRGACVNMGDAVSKVAEVIDAEAFLLDTLPSLIQEIDVDITASPFVSAAAATSASACAVTPDGTAFAYAMNYTATAGAGGNEEAALVITDNDGTVLDKYRISGVSQDRSVNTMVWNANSSKLAVCTTAELWIFTWNGLNLELSERHQTGWEQELIQAGWWTDASGDEYLLAGFDGTTLAGTYDDGVGNPIGGSITTGEYGRQFRSGIHKFFHSSSGQLLLRTFGAQLEAGTLFFDSTNTIPGIFEPPHGYFRLSEHSLAKPRGRRITALAVSPVDGAIFITTTNQGAGPNNTWPPDGSTPYFTVMKLSFAGVLQWELVTDWIDEGTGGFGSLNNDIPTSSTDDPTLLAIAVDQNGDAFVAGRQADSGFSLHKIEGSNGSILWSNNLVSSSTPSAIRQGAISMDPDTGNVWLAGDENNEWKDAGGVYAHLWEIQGSTGTILRSYRINGAPDPTSSTSNSALGVACGPNGIRMVATDTIP